MTPEKVIAKWVDKGGDGGCWLWKGPLGSNGYGRAASNYKTHLAHRFVYQHLVGEIPDGLHLDHLCRVRHCVNPDHLEPVTPQENVRRGILPSINASKTHCPHGHEYTEANTRRGTSKRDRKCKQCETDRQRRQQALTATVNRDKTHCPQGHEYIDENTYQRTKQRGKSRECKLCVKAKRAERVQCPDCGRDSRKGNLSRHRKTHNLRST